MTHTATISHSDTPTVSHTDTPTTTHTSTATATVTASVTPTVTQSVSHTPTITFTRTLSASHTPTVTYTHPHTLTATGTISHTGTRTHTATATATKTITRSATATGTATETATLTVTPTATATLTTSETSTPTATATETLADVCWCYHNASNLSQATAQSNLGAGSDFFKLSTEAVPDDLTGELTAGDCVYYSYNGVKYFHEVTSVGPILPPVSQGVYKVYISPNLQSLLPQNTIIWRCARPTSTATATYTASHTLTVTRTATGTISHTPTLTVSHTPTLTASYTPTISATVTKTSTQTATRTATQTATSTQTATRTATQTATSTQTATRTVSHTDTPTLSQTPTVTVSGTATATATATCCQPQDKWQAGDVYSLDDLRWWECPSWDNSCYEPSNNASGGSHNNWVAGYTSWEDGDVALYTTNAAGSRQCWKVVDEDIVNGASMTAPYDDGLGGTEGGWVKVYCAEEERCWHVTSSAANGSLNPPPEELDSWAECPCCTTRTFTATGTATSTLSATPTLTSTHTATSTATATATATVDGRLKYGCRCSALDPSNCWPSDQIYGIGANPALGHAPHLSVIKVGGICIKIIGFQTAGASNLNYTWDGITYTDCYDCTGTTATFTASATPTTTKSETPTTTASHTSTSTTTATATATATSTATSTGTSTSTATTSFTPTATATEPYEDCEGGADPEWTWATYYNVDDYVCHDGKAWSATRNHTGGSPPSNSNGNWAWQEWRDVCCSVYDE